MIFMKKVTKFATAFALCCFLALGGVAHAQRQGDKKPPPKAKVEVDNPPKKNNPPRDEDKKKNDDERKKDDRKPPLISYLQQLVQ